MDSEAAQAGSANRANKGGFVQAYNAQTAVDSQARVIVAAAITQEANDSKQLTPMIEQTAVNMGRKPRAVSADAGYWSEGNVSGEGVAGMGLYIAAGRLKPRRKRRCGISCEPRPDKRCTRCGRRS